MNIGKFRNRITILKPKREPDGIGGYTESLIPFKKAWASIKVLTSKQQYEAQQLQQKTTHSIMIRYTPGIKNSYKVQFNGSIYEIEGIRNLDMSNEYLELLCSEVGD